MPETPEQTVNRVYREHYRYTGDGLPNEPVGADLPVGDPQSGPWNPRKVHLREVLSAVLAGTEEDADRAETAAEAAEAAQQAAEDAASSVSPTEFPNIATAAALTPTVAANFIRTAGYSTAGDGGGALYKKVASEPSHAGKFSITLDDGVTVVWYEQVFEPRVFETEDVAEAAILGSAPVISTSFHDANQVPGSGTKFVDAGTVDPTSPGQLEVTSNGVTRFYTRSNKVLRPQQFGARSGGDAATNRLAMLEMFALADETGRTIDMGDANDLYEIDQELTYFWTSRPTIRGSGALVKLATGGVEQEQGLRFITPEGFDLEGFGVDGNQETPNPLVLENRVSSQLPSARGVGLSGRNGHRSSVESYFGAAIWIRGHFERVLLIEPDARNMTMDVGAFTPGSNGICGISVGLYGDYGPKLIEVRDPFVENVASLDTSEQRDQDGIRLFTGNIPTLGSQVAEHKVTVTGGAIKNTRGRGIKFQTHQPLVVGTRFSATDPNGYGLGIDFQWGSGTAENCRFFSGFGGGFQFAVHGTQRDYVQGAMTANGCRITSTTGTIQAMNALAYLYSDVGHQPGVLNVTNCAQEQSAALCDHIARYHSRTTNNAVVVTNNAFRNVGVSGVLGEGGVTIRAAINGNVGLGSAKPLTSGATFTGSVSPSNNIGFT